MAKINLKYIAHFSLLTGKLEEGIEVREKTTAGDLIKQLGEKYSGFQEVLVDEKTGRLNSRNKVAIRKAGRWTENITTLEGLNMELSDGDTLIFW